MSLPCRAGPDVRPHSWAELHGEDNFVSIDRKGNQTMEFLVPSLSWAGHTRERTPYVFNRCGSLPEQCRLQTDLLLQWVGTWWWWSCGLWLNHQNNFGKLLNLFEPLVPRRVIVTTSQGSHENADMCLAQSLMPRRCSVNISHTFPPTFAVDACIKGGLLTHSFI